MEISEDSNYLPLNAFHLDVRFPRETWFVPSNALESRQVRRNAVHLWFAPSVKSTGLAVERCALLPSVGWSVGPLVRASVA